MVTDFKSIRDNLNSIRSENSRNVENKKREYMEEKFMSFKQTLRTKVTETYTYY